MSFLIHILLTTLISYIIFSYLSGTYILFLAKYPSIKDQPTDSKAFVWMLSPAITLVWIYKWISSFHKK